MLTSDIVLHLRENLPLHTDLFSSGFQASSITIVGTNVTVTSVGHNLSTDDIVTVTDSTFLNPIADIDNTGDYPVFTTSSNHDLTQGYSQKVLLTSVTQPSVDGEYDIESVLSRTIFEVSNFPNTALTDVVLNEKRPLGINGIYNITVIDVDTFEFELESELGTTLQVDAGAVNFQSQVRVSGASTIEECIKAYELQTVNDLWGFVVLSDTITSKDSRVTTESLVEQKNQNFWRNFYLSPFNFFVFIPTNFAISGRVSRDAAETLRPDIFKSLLGVSFDTGFSTTEAENTVSAIGDGIHSFKKTYYIHQFAFQQTATIGQDDVYQGGPTVNFNSIQLNALDEADGNIIQSTKILLD